VETSRLATPYNAIRLAEQGRLKEAIELAKQIPWALWKCYTFREIAKIAAKRRNSAMARTAIDLSKQSVSEIEDDDYQKAIQLRDIASAKAELGLIDEALQDIDSSIEQASRLDDPSVKVGTMREIALEIAKHKDRDQRFLTKARQALNRAIMHASSVQDDSVATFHFADIAEALSEIGFQDDAVPLFYRAAGLAKKVQDDEQRFMTITEIAKRTLMRGLVSDGQAIIDEAIQEARRTEEEWDRSRRISSIVEVLVDAAVKDDTNRQILLAKAYEVAGEATEKWWKSKTISDIALAEAEMGNVTKAEQLLQSVEFEDLKERVRNRIQSKKIVIGLTEPQPPQTPRSPQSV